MIVKGSSLSLCVIFQRMLFNLILKDVLLPVLTLKNGICLCKATLSNLFRY